MERVYLVTLAKETESPLGPRSDEVGKAKKERRTRTKTADEQKTEDKKARIKRCEGRRSRLPSRSIPMAFTTAWSLLRSSPANYSDLGWWTIGFFTSAARSPTRKTRTKIRRAREAEIPSLLLQPGGSQGDRPWRRQQYEITLDGKKMLVKIDKDYAVIDLPKDKTRDERRKAGKDYKLKLEGSTCGSIATPSGTRSTSSAGGRCAISSTRRT